MATKKIIVVIGATGNQGGSVARTFLDLSQWHVRCLTRNPRSEQSRELASRGAEIVQGDLDDPGSLKPVFEGATAIFLNTDFWQTWRPARAALEAEGKDIAEASQMAFDAETSRGRNAVDVASTIPTLQRFVYSSLPDITKVDGGKHIRSKHTASKGWIVDYIADKYPELNKKTSLIYLGAYTNNPFLTPRHDPGSGKYVFALPMTEDVKMPVIDARESTGPFVRALVEDEEPGTKLLAYDQEATIGEIVKFWSQVRGQEAMYKYVSPQVMHDRMGVSWEHLDPIDAFHKHGYVGGDIAVLRPNQLKTPMAARTWEQLLATTAK